jgi:hypothetical protein
MTQETLRWKLFLFSLVDIAEQWYTSTIGSVDNWEELRGDFCYSSPPLECLDFPTVWIPWIFFLLDSESVGAAWARFSHLLELSSDMSILEDVSLCTFYMRVDMESAQELDLLAGGSFEHQSPMEWIEILEFFLEASPSHTSHNEPHQESELIHESHLIDEFELSPCTSDDLSREPSMESRTPKEEEIQPSEFSHIFEKDSSGDIINASNKYRHEILQHWCTFLRSSMKFGIMGP